MSPAFAVFIMMNNYFHDVATAMLMACSVTMWAVLKQYENKKSPEARAFLMQLHNAVSKIVNFSFVWIIISAIPRILTLSTFEWKIAVNSQHTYGLVTKYILALFMITVGTYLWILLSARIKRLK